MMTKKKKMMNNGSFTSLSIEIVDKYVVPSFVYIYIFLFSNYALKAQVDNRFDNFLNITSILKNKCMFI